MSDTFCDATQEYINENGVSTAISVVDNNDLLTPPTTSEANSLIRLITTDGINSVYILSTYPDGEIRFLTADAKNNNNLSGNLLYNAKVNENGKLCFYHSYTISNPLKASGWYDIGQNISEIETANTIRDIALTATDASVVALFQDLATINNTIVILQEETVEANIVLANHQIRLNFLEYASGFDVDTIALNTTNRTNIQTASQQLFELIYANATPSSAVVQGIRAKLGSRYVVIATNIINNTITGLGIIGFGAVAINLLRQIYDIKKNDEYAKELINLQDNLSQLSISTVNDTLNHTGLTITSGNTGYVAGSANTTYKVNIQREALLVIYISSGLVASVLNVEEYGISTFNISETISIPKASLGGGTGGNLVLTVASLGTLKEWTELRINYLITKVKGIEVKNRRKQGVIGADDIDTTQFTTTNVSYTDTTDPINETITYKQLKSRLNLLPTGTSDVDIYTSTGQIGIGTTPTAELHTYHATANILRLETSTTGTNSIEFKRGTATDIFTDYRLISETGLFKLQYENNLLAYGASGTDLLSSTSTLTTNYKDTTFNGKVSIGNPIHATYKVDVNGDINISTGSLYRVNGSAYKPAGAVLADTATDLATGAILSVGKGGTGATTFIADGLLIGNTTSALTQNAGLFYTTATSRLTAPNMNVPTGGKYKINGVDLSYNDLTNKLTPLAGGGITINASNEIGATGFWNNVITGSGVLQVVEDNIYFSTAKVGIGANTTPTSLLHMKGNATHGGTLTIEYVGNTPSLELTRATGTASANYNWIVKNDNAFKIDSKNLATAYTTKFEISGVGDVGIGVATNTLYKLGVNGDINIPTGYLYKVNGSAYKPAGAVLADTATDLATGAILSVGKGGTGTTTFTANGLLIGNTTSAITQNAGLFYTTATSLLTAGNMNVPTGGKYKINSVDLSYNDLTFKPTLGNGLTFSTAGSASVSPVIGLNLSAGTGISINTGVNPATIGATYTSANLIGIFNSTQFENISSLIQIKSSVLSGGSWTAGTPSTNIYYNLGNVGIGATATSAVDNANSAITIPTATLFVKGALTAGATCDVVIKGGLAGSNNGKAKLWLSADAYHSSYIQSEHTGSGYTQLTFGTANGNSLPIERMRVWNNGAVGIQGIYNSGSASGGYAIFNSFMSAGSLAIGNIDQNYGGGNNWTTNTAGLIMECLNNTEIVIHDAGNSLMSFMYYTTNGNFRMGRNMGYGNGNITMAGYLEVEGTILSKIGVYARNGYDALLICDGGGMYLKFGTLNTGNVDFLEISASGGATNINSNSNRPIYLRQYGYNTSFIAGFTQNGANSLYWNTISDQRIKENIKKSNLQTCYDNVKNINLYRYNYINGFNDKIKDKTQLGFIAQQLKQHFPKSVSREKIRIDDKREIPDLANIDIAQVNFTLFGAVKQLMKVVEKQSKRIKKLEEMLGIVDDDVVDNDADEPYERIVCDEVDIDDIEPSEPVGV